MKIRAVLEDAYSVDASRLFPEQIIEHHWGGIDMAQEELDTGGNALAPTIIAAQTAETATKQEILGSL